MSWPNHRYKLQFIKDANHCLVQWQQGWSSCDHGTKHGLCDWYFGTLWNFCSLGPQKVVARTRHGRGDQQHKELASSHRLLGWAVSQTASVQQLSSRDIYLYFFTELINQDHCLAGLQLSEHCLWCLDVRSGWMIGLVLCTESDKILQGVTAAIHGCFISKCVKWR